MASSILYVYILRSIRTCGLVRDLREEGGDLTLAGAEVAGGGELGERPGGLDEGGVGVEPLGRAGRIVLVQEQGVVQLLAHQRRGGATLPVAAVPPRLRYAGAAGSNNDSDHGGDDQ